MIHLDTSFLIRALGGSSTEDARLRAWLRRGEFLGISALAWGEFHCGPLVAGVADLARELVPDVVACRGAEAERAAALYSGAGRRRGSFADCIIAATAIEGEARLATSNVADFERFVPMGLVLAD